MCLIPNMRLIMKGKIDHTPQNRDASLVHVHDSVLGSCDAMTIVGSCLDENS